MSDEGEQLWPPADTVAMIRELIAECNAKHHIDDASHQLRNPHWGHLKDQITIFARKYWQPYPGDLFEIADIINGVFLIVLQPGTLEQFAERHTYIHIDEEQPQSQLTLQRALEQPKPNPRLSFLSWLSIITRNYCLAIRKRQGLITFLPLENTHRDASANDDSSAIAQRLSEYAQDGETQVQLRIFIKEVWAFLAQQDPVKVACLVYDALFDYPQKEIAQRLGLEKAAQVRQYIHELREKLRAMRATYDNEPLTPLMVQQPPKRPRKSKTRGLATPIRPQPRSDSATERKGNNV